MRCEQLAALEPPWLGRLIALAERDPRRAVRLLRATVGSTPTHRFERLALGWALLRWERTDEAAALLETAAAQFGATGEQALARRSRFGLLVALQVAGAGAALQDDWDALCADHLRADEPVAAARARCEQIAHLNMMGRFSDAAGVAALARAPVELHGTLADRARLLHVVGVTTAGCGDLDEADRLLAAAVAAFAALRRPIAVARVRFEQAWVLARRERYLEASAVLESARPTFERFALPLRVAMCDRDIGYCLQRLGALGEAIACTVRARAVFRSLQVPVPLATCDLNLGTVAHYSGLFDLAEAAYIRAQAVYEGLGARRLALICRRNRAMLLLERGYATDALDALAPLLAEAHAVGDAVEVAETMAVRGRALAATSLDGALSSLSAAREQFVVLGNSAGAAECLLEAGWLHLRGGNLERAETAFASAIPPLANRPIHLWRAHYGLGRVAETSGALAVALDHYERASAFVAQLRLGIASEHASSALFGQARQLMSDALSLAARLNDAARLLAFAEQQRALALQQSMADATPAADAALAVAEAELRALLASDAPPATLDGSIEAYVAALLEARNLVAPAPPAARPDRPQRHAPGAARGVATPTPAMSGALSFDLDALRHSLVAIYGEGWSLLAPLMLEQELLLLLVTPQGLSLTCTPRDAALAELLERACSPVQRPFTYRDLESLRAGTAPRWRVLRELARRLLPPALLKRLGPEHRLLIVPDGPLHALPWAALRLKGAWLAERAVVELVPALRLLQPAAPLAVDAPALLLACAEFGQRAPKLPHALASLEQAAAHWPGSADRIAGSAATRKALLERSAQGELRQYGLLHIATHAQIGSRGLLAHIKLADDNLLLAEVMRLALGSPVVVLAACSGAAGEVLSGDEVLSLSRALLVAGARAVVGGLWQLYDGTVLALLGPFYKALAQGSDPALALALAQRTLIHAEHHEQQPLHTPLVWGSLCVTSVGLTHRL